MGVENIDKMFQPETVAVIGASEREGSIGNAIMGNLVNGGFSGMVCPVNPKHKTIWGLPAHNSIMDLDTAADLVIISTPIVSVPDIIRECAEAGVGGAVIVSAGGKETGEKGRALEKAIKEDAKSSALRIIGPNCLGIINTRAKLNASFGRRMPLPGRMAFISQSGAICTSILDLSIKEQFGFSYFISLGSMLDVDFGDMIDYLGSDPDVSSIVMYIEGFTRFRNFMSAARAVSRVKPVIALKAGRTKAGAKAAASHTGAMAGEDAIYDAAFKRAGIVRVKTFEELFDCSEMLAKQPKPYGSGLGIITNAGGPGVMASDALADYGLDPVPLSSETLRQLDEILPSYWSRANPIDILGDASPERFQKAVEICLNAPEINGLLIMLSPVALINPTDVAKVLAEMFRNKSYPVITSWIGGFDVEEGVRIFNQAGVPTFDTPERAVRAFMDLYIYGKNIEMLQEIPSKVSGKIEFDHNQAKAIIDKGIEDKNHILTEVEAKRLLSSYGIPVNQTIVATDANEAVKKAGEIGYPVVMKIFSREITHKTDAGGVCLNLGTDAEVADAFTEIITKAARYAPDADIEGVTIQPMLKSMDYELILGAKKDPDFGPVILFGMGGMMTEVLKDRAIALPPLNRLLARRLMEETKVYQVLKGFRNNPPADLVLLEEIIIRLSQLVTDFPEIEELDINPLFVAQSDICAVDARVVIKPSEVLAPLHLVISPYPNQYESTFVCEGVGELFIRPIRPEDAPLLIDLFETLSPQSVYFRFFGHLKRLPHSMLARFTQIDYDREIALVALSESESGDKILGAVRVITEINSRMSEFAIVVGDPWQGKGIAAALFSRCLSIAKEHGIKKIWGMVLPENIHMLNLGKKLGFNITRMPGSNNYELQLDLTVMPEQ